MVKEILNYNFVPGHIGDGDFAALFEKRRRDSCFAFVHSTDSGDIVALRDHLGTVPLYYRVTAEGVRFSVSLADLATEQDVFDRRGVDSFLSIGTARLAPLIRGVGIVPPGSVIRFGTNGAPPEVLYRYHVPTEGRVSASIDDLADELDRLMLQAITRTVKADPVGLYMSGGIDSGLVAIYLKRAGAAVNAYTSATSGTSGVEIPFAKTIAAKAEVRNHAIVPLDTGRYAQYVRDAHHLYGSPHGTSTLIGVSSLWQHSSIGAEQQVYLGQNADAMTCSTSRQYLVYFLHRLPRTVRRRLHPALGCPSALSDYLSLTSLGKVTEYDDFSRRYGTLDPLSLLTLAGQYIAATPRSGECLSLPAVRRGVIASNPYYDMDVVEHCLQTPLRHRIAVSRSSKVFLTLDKKVYRKLAERHLPRELVYRKKGFTIPFHRDEASRAFQSSLPRDWCGESLTDSEQRFAASVLTHFAREHHIAECISDRNHSEIRPVSTVTG
jgi:asparagine synthetase B (glutamine-hydrolysing)